VHPSNSRLPRSVSAGIEHHLIRDPERHQRLMEEAHRAQVMYVVVTFIVVGVIALVFAVIHRVWVAGIGGIMMLASVGTIHLAESVRGTPSTRRGRNLVEIAWWVATIGLFVGGIILQGLGHVGDAGVQ